MPRPIFPIFPNSPTIVVVLVVPPTSDERSSYQKDRTVKVQRWQPHAIAKRVARTFCFPSFASGALK